MILPSTVQTMSDTFLAMVDSETPDLIEGLYLVGSIALGDFRPHRSDVDFIAVSEGPADASSLSALERIHTHIQERWPRPFFDGIYVSWDDLAADPTRLGPRPSAHEGHFDTGSNSTDPIAWQTLAQSGICCRGPQVADLQIWQDRAVLDTWTDTNLDAYWQRRVLESSGRLLTRNGLAGMSEWACEWCVTGVSRLHYTLSTGAITSKEGAGVYAHATFPGRWRRVVEEALRIRRADGSRSLYLSRLSRRRDVRAFTQMVITDAHRIYASHYPQRPE